MYLNFKNKIAKFDLFNNRNHNIFIKLKNIHTYVPNI